MKYSVFLHRYSTGLYEAIIPAVPGTIGRGTTRKEALERLRAELMQWLETTEIITIDVPVPMPEGEKINSCPETAGMFNDDSVQESIRNETCSFRDLPESSKTSLADEPVFGMWKNREDLRDSRAWLRNIRKEQWTKKDGSSRHC